MVTDPGQRYEAWLVDLDGTLYRPLPVRLAMVVELALFGWGAVRTLRRFRREHERLRETLDEAVDDPYSLQLRRAAGALGMDAEAVRAVAGEWMHRRPCKWLRLFRRRALLAEIGSFRAGGGKTALVSDYPARAKLAGLGAAGLFDAVVANGEPGGPRRLKPHPEGYLEAARHLGVEPADCLVHGDRDDADGAAARAAGMAYRQIG